MVRTDLAIPQQIVQAAHAAQESGFLTNKLTGSVNNLIVCQTINEESLLIEYDKLLNNGIQVILFREPDLGNQVTSLSTIPLSKESRRFFRKWKLWDYIPGERP